MSLNNKQSNKIQKKLNKKPAYISVLRISISIFYLIIFILPPNIYTNKFITLIAIIGNCLLIEVNGSLTLYGNILVFWFYTFYIIRSYKMRDINEKIHFIIFIIFFQSFFINILNDYDIMHITFFN